MRCFCILFSSDFLYKSICCGYSFELHRQVDAIQMGTHNICLYNRQVDAIQMGTHNICLYNRQVDAIQMGTHNICLYNRQVDAIQMGTHNICLYKEIDKKYTGCIKSDDYGIA